MVFLCDNVHMKDLIIIGGGPAGAGAAVYAARKQLNSILIAGEIGGQSTVSEDIQNWIGSPHISGADLAKSLEAHVNEYKGNFVEIKKGLWVYNITKEKNTEGHEYFTVHTKNHSGAEESFDTRTVLVTTGSIRRKLPAIDANKFEHKGVTYCASCDGPVFSGQDVVVVGGGNAALESAAQLLAYCKTVTLINRTKNFKADPVTVEKVLAHKNLTLIENATITKVNGNAFVESIDYVVEGQEPVTLPTAGVFVEIGQLPNTDFVKELVDLTQFGNIIVDPMRQMSSMAGIWAAGDCTNGLYHQNNIAAGDAVKALEDIYQWVKKN